MVRKIFDGQMPPGDPLPGDERDTIQKWIQAGAPWAAAEKEAVPQRADLASRGVGQGFLPPYRSDTS